MQYPCNTCSEQRVYQRDCSHGVTLRAYTPISIGPAPGSPPRPPIYAPYNGCVAVSAKPD